MTRYPSVEDAIAIHTQLIDKFGGGVPGTRSGGARSGPCEAAALWESLSQNHPFVDGNKRIAVTMTAAFLAVNGYKLEFRDDEAFLFLNGLYETGRMRLDELDSWLRSRVSSREGRP